MPHVVLDPPGAGALAVTVVVWPLARPPLTTSKQPLAAGIVEYVGAAEPDAMKNTSALVHDVPVLWPKVNVRLPACSSGDWQRYPELATQVVPRNELLLNTPSENSAASTIAIISMAHPYVIRYSIALCAFLYAFPIKIYPCSSEI